VPSLGWYLLILVVAAASTAAFVLPIRKIAIKVGYVDTPNERKMHAKAIPYGGGGAMFVGVAIAISAAALIPDLRPLFQGNAEILGVLIASAAIFGVGLLDDFRPMSAPAKIAGQVLAASILYFAGVTMYQLKLPFAGFIVLSPGVIPLITAMWVVALANAINLIDGLDGLAAGIVAIGAGSLAVYGIQLERLGLLPGQNIGPLIAVIACGICLGYLPFNVHPAKIFMGDAGALLLGLLMSASTMVIGGRTAPASGVTFFFFAPIFIPFFILGVPLVDAAFAFIRRTARGQGFHAPDKDHIHHRLLRLGHGPRRTVVILWAWTALLCGFVLYPLFKPRANALVPFAVLALGVGLYTWFHPGLRSSDDGGDEALEDQSAPEEGQPPARFGADAPEVQ
jgi:UDP-GlcNAc:undecaprenyl-phosphate GlcNAc-1-phosphate transferase